jgi:hypothetical protein
LSSSECDAAAKQLEMPERCGNFIKHRIANQSFFGIVVTTPEKMRIGDIEFGALDEPLKFEG